MLMHHVTCLTPLMSMMHCHALSTKMMSLVWVADRTKVNCPGIPRDTYRLNAYIKVLRSYSLLQTLCCISCTLYDSGDEVAKLLPDGMFNTITVALPWQWNNYSRRHQSASSLGTPKCTLDRPWSTDRRVCLRNLPLTSFWIQTWQDFNPSCHHDGSDLSRSNRLSLLVDLQFHRP